MIPNMGKTIHIQMLLPELLAGLSPPLESGLGNGIGLDCPIQPDEHFTHDLIYV